MGNIIKSLFTLSFDRSIIGNNISFSREFEKDAKDFLECLEQRPVEDVLKR